MERKTNRTTGWNQVSYDKPAKPVMPPVTAVPLPAPAPQPPVITVPQCEDECKVVAMAYVKRQRWIKTYEPEVALERGTAFPDLDLPFVGEGACPND